MENQPIGNQIKTKIWKMSANTCLVFVILLGIMALVITSHPPQYYHDLNGLGEAFLLITFMKALGVISIICGFLFLKRKVNKFSAILLILIGISYFFSTTLLIMRRNIEKILYHKAFVEQEIHYKEIADQATNFTFMGFARAFSQPVIINDVESDLIYLKNEHGIFILEVTNAKEIGLLSNPSLFRNKSVTLTIDKEYLASHGGIASLPMTEEGATLIRRNASPELKKRYDDYSAQYPGQWRTSDWYSGIENDSYVTTYLPVIIKLN